MEQISQTTQGNSVIISGDMGLTTPPIAEQKLPSIPKRDITIRQLDKGYIVTVGCQTVAIEKVDKLIEKLSQYLKNPLESERLYNENKFL